MALYQKKSTQAADASITGSGAIAVKKKRSWKKVVFPAVAIVLVGVLCFRFLPLFKTSASMSVTYQEVSAERRDLSVLLSGSGTLAPAETASVTAQVKGEILECLAEEGDTVVAGDVLYRVDSSEAENSIKKAENSLEKAQMSHQELLESVSNLSVSSDVSGVITTLYVAAGDQVQNGAKIADVLDQSYMTITLPFNSFDADQIHVGQAASVVTDGTFETLSGSVTKVSALTQVLDGYQIVRDVTIRVKNPGALSAGTAASATVGSLACNQSGTFEALSSSSITAKTSGTISSLYYQEGDTISSGATIVTLENTSVENQIKSSSLSLDDAQLSLDDTYNTLEQYTITAPISGMIVSKSASEGDNLSSGGSLLTIYDLTALTFSISVDELDIQQVELGQEVTVTAEALEGETFLGEVTYISLVGTSQSGVTYYPITVTIDEPGNLLAGMNVSAEIVVESAEHALTIPVSAVARGNMVLLKTEGSTSDNNGSEDDTANDNTFKDGSSEEDASKEAFNDMSMMDAPDGYTYVTIELGLNDDDYIEVISGLEDGDIVGIAVVVTAAETSNQDANSLFGNLFGGSTNSGSAGGEMPSRGEMPSGGDFPSGGEMPSGGPSGGGMGGGF